MKVRELIRILNKVKDKEKIVNLIDTDFKGHDVAQIDIEDDVYVDIHCDYEEEDCDEYQRLLDDGTLMEETNEQI
jgi:hypothetical protein